MSTRHGNCNFRNLEHNTVCGCQEFTPEDDDASSTSTAARARKTCLCGHFINFHTKPTEEPKEPKKPLLAESFRSARLRSGATSPNSTVDLTNSKRTPATQPIHEYEETYTLSKTFEDPIRYQPNQQVRTLSGSFGENALGIDLRSTRDGDRSNGGRSGDSSAVTEIAPPFSYFPGRLHPNLLSEPLREQWGAPPLRSARSSPLLGNQAIQGLNFSRGIADDATNASTVADSPIITGKEGYVEFGRMVHGALHVVKGLSQPFLPLHIQEGRRMQNPNIGRDGSPLIVFDGREPYDEELQRQALAAESQLHTLAGLVASRIRNGMPDEEPRNRVEELPQSVPTESPARPQAMKSSPAKVSEKGPSSDAAVPSSPPPLSGNEVAISAATTSEPINPISESFVNKKIHEINEKVDLQEEICNDVMNFKKDTEQDIAEIGNNVFSLEERFEHLEKELTRLLEDQSFLKRAREDDDEDSSGENRGERRSKKRRRRRHDTSTDLRTPSSVEKNYTTSFARGSEVNQLPDGTIKQTLTTTTSFTHSTSTSFNSASSSSTSTRKTNIAALKALSNKFGMLSNRLMILESVAAPCIDRPWIVQIVVLPPSTWTTFRFDYEKGELVENRGPRILQPSMRAWKRLSSRGLIKTIEITGGEARDVERAIRKTFGRVFKALHENTEYSEGDGRSYEKSYEWSPLRKAAKQITLRTLSANEMSNQFWKVDFLRGTCVEELGPPPPSPTSSGLPSSDPPVPTKSSQMVSLRSGQPGNQMPPKPTHRLYITNCWTSGMTSSWDTTRDNTQTQISSVPCKLRAGSVISTQPSSLGGGALRRKTRVDDRASLSPRMMSSQPGHRSGWNDIWNLPAETTYIHDNKHEIASMKPRPVEDEAFWYYDIQLDGPRDDHIATVEGSAPDAAPNAIDLVDKDELANALPAIKPTKRQSGRRKADSQRSHGLASQQSNHETASLFSFQQPSLLSQPSFNGRAAPSLSRDGTNLSLGMLSHDSDSTPKARSFVGTPPPPINTSFGNGRVLRSRRNKGSKNTNDEKTPTNSMIGDPRVSPALIRTSSRESDHNGEALQLSRCSTVEDDPPASLLSNPHNSDETNAELIAKYGSSTINKHFEPLTPYSVPIEDEQRSEPRE